MNKRKTILQCMNRLVVVLIGALLFACKGKEASTSNHIDIHQLQSMGTLATTEYTFGKIVQLNDNKDWYRLGDRKLLIRTKAKVKAGIDLAKVEPNDIVVEGSNKISLLLPFPEVVSFEMNPNDIATEMTDVNGFRFEFSQEEKVRVLQMGEKRIREEMMQSKMMLDAKKNARVFLTDFYQALGFEHIIIEFKPSEESGAK